MLETAVVEATLQRALAGGGDFADVFVEDRAVTSATYDDRKVEEMRSGRSRGAGIRVVAGETTGFAHTTDLTAEGLATAAGAAAAAAKAGGPGTRVAALTRRDAPAPHEVVTLPGTVAKARKVEMLARADDAARAESDSISQVTSSYADSRRQILVANSDGVLATDDQVRTRFAVQCVASGDTGLQTGMEAPGRTIGFEFFDEHPPEEIARIAAARAVGKLSARPAPSGKLPVVLRRGAGGVLFHEACGHGLEADLVNRDASVFRGMVGERVAGKGVTLVDDGTFARDWGACAIDDEGAPAQRNVLIDDGVLTDYMWDLLRARRAGRPSTANGRRETYQHLPMVRMTNTYITPGTEDPDEIIRQTPYGLYCVALGGGQVNTATGDFVFGITEAYMIEDGKITEPVHAAQLIGNGPETLRAVDVVGNDFDTWTGMCGKDGQSVPVSSGQPTLRVAELTVGGTARVSGELAEIAAGVAGAARDGEQVEAYVVRSHETEVKVFDGAVESLAVAEAAGIGVRVVVDGRQGIAYAGSLDADVVASVLADAPDNASYGAADPAYGLATPADVDGVASPTLDLWRDDVLATPTEAKVALAIAADRAVLASDARVRGVESTDYGDAALEMAMVASTGVQAAIRRTSSSVSSLALAGERDETQTGYGFDVARSFGELDIDRVASMAAERSTRMLGATQPATRRVAVVFDPMVTASVLALIGSALSGEAVLKGRSMFADRLGETIAAPSVTIVDDPTNPEAYGATPVDGEGVPTRTVPLVRDGVLLGFLHNLYTARRTGSATTGSAVRGYASTPGVGARALHLAPGAKGAAEVLAAVPEALYVQSVSGLHSGTNAVSGDFSVGAEGLMVRDGQFAEPVREITVASTLQRMLQDVVEVGSDLTWLPGGTAGVTLLVADMTMAGS